jgi:hypothetical protein
MTISSKGQNCRQMTEARVPPPQTDDETRFRLPCTDAAAVAESLVPRLTGSQDGPAAPGAGSSSVEVVSVGQLRVYDSVC